jgi:hypothetical protein
MLLGSLRVTQDSVPFRIILQLPEAELPFNAYSQVSFTALPLHASIISGGMLLVAVRLRCPLCGLDAAFRP